MEERQVITVLESFEAGHGHDAAEVADRFQRRPVPAVVLRERPADRVEAREHDQPFLPR
jgi:hypothetical protein